MNKLSKIKLQCLIFRHEKSGNADLAEAISQWVFKEKGVIRVKSVRHHLVKETKPPAAYTIMDEVVSYLLNGELGAN